MSQYKRNQVEEAISATMKRAYDIADNKLALNAGWDEEILAEELKALAALDFDISITGFSIAEIDSLIEVSSGLKAPCDLAIVPIAVQKVAPDVSGTGSCLLAQTRRADRNGIAVLIR